MKLQYFELDKPYVENQQRIEELMDSAALTYEEARRLPTKLERSEKRIHIWIQMYDLYGRAPL